MSVERIDVGSVPCDEPCQQVGMPSYDGMKARKECRVYMHQLERVFGKPPGSARFRVAANNHDFGTYHSVEIRYDATKGEEVEYAYKVDGDCPAKWDDKALIELMPTLHDQVDACPPNRF
jgi:hypothetical protein